MNNIIVMKELLLFFKGENGTEIPCSYSDLPTDPTKVIDKIKNEFITDNIFRNTVIDNIIRLSQDAKYSWFSLYYLYLVFRLINDNKLPINIKEVIFEIEKGIISSEHQLRSTFNWVGSNYKNGLWGDVERLTNIIFEEFGFLIYPKGI